MSAEAVVRAMVMFAVTNVDDVVLLALYFARATGHHRAVRRVVVGQYVGFTGILAVSLAAAVGLGQFDDSVIAYLGLVPLALGLRAAHDVAREGETALTGPSAPSQSGVAPSMWTVAAVTFANGGDNIGIYVPVFTAASTPTLTTYVVVFLLGVAAACIVGRAVAARPLVARGLARWGHILLPIVLCVIGGSILIHGGAFGL
ncbi:cadmium transporter [Conexibacter sp. W3-3-2]|uniref:cadmium resistance transporter n=1 Tax=Conexibacter sp. W3-3-2 TaxID=2675227 RepID=UPI0012B9859F|nr:cadmium resistance transporter [Conexibacter sp. W3-3-2]MTD43654.1 cadmium transporter [Conexibacter sp. W3-3-2]